MRADVLLTVSRQGRVGCSIYLVQHQGLLRRTETQGHRAYKQYCSLTNRIPRGLHHWHALGWGRLGIPRPASYGQGSCGKATCSGRQLSHQHRNLPTKVQDLNHEGSGPEGDMFIPDWDQFQWRFHRKEALG